jgi:hypothetical protein
LAVSRPANDGAAAKFPAALVKHSHADVESALQLEHRAQTASEIFISFHTPCGPGDISTGKLELRALICAIRGDVVKMKKSIALPASN